MDNSNYKKKFEKDGYLWIKDFFNNEEIEMFKKAFEDRDWYSKSKLASSPEISSHPELKRILTNEKLNSLLNLITDNRAVYFGSGALVGNTYENSVTWRRLHVDTRGNKNNPFGKTYYDPSKFDWPVINLFIYLEDFENYSGCLKVIKGSHKKFLPTIGNYLKVFFNISKNYKFDGKYSLKSIPFANFFKMENIRSKPGDLFVFNHALHHSPNSLILRFFPKITLPVLLENILGKYFKFLFKPNVERRRIITVAYGKDSEEMENFIKSRVQFLNNEYVNYSPFFNNEEYRNELLKSGLKVNINLKKYIQDFKAQ